KDLIKHQIIVLSIFVHPFTDLYPTTDLSCHHLQQVSQLHQPQILSPMFYLFSPKDGFSHGNEQLHL
ncbi:hypothetical protein, partial [Acinetobacter baumannii]|uniref:hypothetical protein n=1 Tax=Acinetobacter baumannii TaxID=470 RepID=UPI001BB463EE